ATLQYQQSILRDLAQQSSTNPLTYPLVGTLNSYLSIPQTQRIPQLLRFVSSLTPQESAVIHDLVETYKDYKKSQ
ncbi:transcriptional regulator cudA, putative, partial [Entamoeba invadens IP1]